MHTNSDKITLGDKASSTAILTSESETIVTMSGDMFMCTTTYEKRITSPVSFISGDMFMCTTTYEKRITSPVSFINIHSAARASH